MKLWKKGVELDKRVEEFTVGRDHELDLRLVGYDCVASKAHARMLKKIGILSGEELASLIDGLDEIIALDGKGEFGISRADEDCHTAIENYLTDQCGDAGKKIHTGRSRNDQVLTAMRLYEIDAITEIVAAVDLYRAALARLVERDGKTGIPGYTHMQRAMPTTIGTWAGSFYAAAGDDGTLLDSVKGILDQSPLGSAAGFGTPVIPLDRVATSEEMGFARVMENPIYAQLSRGKMESLIAAACGQVMLGVNKLASDLIMFGMREFGFVTLPETLCTGSSIMPQKKNPDVLELMRARYHVVLGEEMKIRSMSANLISGYNRDLQLTKGPIFEVVDATLANLGMAVLVLDGLSINADACAAAMTDELFATEKAYELVVQGVPFREAYRTVADSLRVGEKGAASLPKNK